MSSTYQARLPLHAPSPRPEVCMHAGRVRERRCEVEGNLAMTTAHGALLPLGNRSAITQQSNASRRSPPGECARCRSPGPAAPSWTCTSDAHTPPATRRQLCSRGRKVTWQSRGGPGKQVDLLAYEQETSRQPSSQQWQRRQGDGGGRLRHDSVGATGLSSLLTSSIAARRPHLQPFHLSPYEC
eukprot:203684-Chlamydomonas_euryale.AAC.1